MNNNKSSMNSHSKLWLHIWFWCLHIGIVLVLVSSSSDGDRNLAFIWLSLISLLMYCITVGRFASRNGRSGILWGGLSLLLSPVGVWISYLATFFIKAKQPDSTNVAT